MKASGSPTAQASDSNVQISRFLVVTYGIRQLREHKL
jgi:hypothetical protein